MLRKSNLTREGRVLKEALMVGVIGKNPIGSELNQNVYMEGVKLDHVIVDRGSPINVMTRTDAVKARLHSSIVPISGIRMTSSFYLSMQRILGVIERVWIRHREVEKEVPFLVLTSDDGFKTPIIIKDL